MDTKLIIRELTLLVIVATGWIIGYIEHKSPTKEETLRLPCVIRMLFGKTKDSELSVRGVLIQLFMYSLFINVTLYNLEKLSSNQMVRAIGWTGVLLLLLTGMHYMRRK